jgi:cell wall-associated NlpC family hydrolase
MAPALASLLFLAAAARPAREAVVVRPVENMYSAPSLDVDVVSQATLGQVVVVHETKGVFRRIETPDRYRGWIRAAALLNYVGPEAPRYAAKGTVAEVVNLMANVYREMSITSARPRTEAPMGTRLEVVGEPKEGWHRVRLPDGTFGFIQDGDVRLQDAAARTPRGTEAELVATARRFLGVPYLWGGMTVRGLDCSGYVRLVYHVHGIELRRDADLQYDQTDLQKVERADLQPGDLVFFGKPKPTHVGLYSGEGRFLSATPHNTPVVQEDPLDDPHWSTIYLGARRPR